jgi:O-antigen ligase
LRLQSLRAQYLRPTRVVVAALVLAAAIAGAVVASRQDSLPDAVIVGAGTLVVICGLAVAPWVHPGLPIGLGVLLAVFSGNWGYMGVPVGVDRPLVAYGLLCALLRLLPDAPRPIRLRFSRVHVLFVVVAALGVGSAISAGTFGESTPTFALSESLGIFGFCIFTAATSVFGAQRSRDLLLIGFVVLGGYLGVTACLEGFGLDALVLPRYIVDPTVGIHFDRARGPFAESGSFGLALFVGAVASCMAFVRWPRKGTRAICVAVVCACALGIVFTLTRQVWLGAMAGVAVAMIVTPGLRRWLVPVFGGGAVLVLLMLALAPGLRGSAGEREADRLPVYDRLNSDRAAIAMAADKPIFGFGWYSFPTASLPFLEQAETYPLRSVPIAHNVFLGMFSELGLVGGTLWILMVGIVIGTAIVGRAPPNMRPWQIGLVAIAADWFVVANLAPASGAFTNHVLWLWAGVIWSVLPREAVVERVSFARAARGRPTRPLEPRARGALLVLGAVMFGIVGYAAGHLRSPEYSARTQLILGNARSDLLNYAFIEEGRESWASTWARLSTSDRVIVPAARAASVTPGELREHLVVTPLLGHPEISVRATGGTPSAAKRRSGAVAAVLTKVIASFNRQQSTVDELDDAYRSAGVTESRARSAVSQAGRRLGELARRFDDLGRAQVAPLFQAQARAQTATLRRVTLGLRVQTLTTVDRSLTNLRPGSGPVVYKNDRGSFAALIAYFAGLVGLAVAAWFGVFPRRSRR